MEVTGGVRVTENVGTMLDYTDILCRSSASQSRFAGCYAQEMDRVARALQPASCERQATPVDLPASVRMRLVSPR